ncbi:MAG: gamma-glutamyltransferase [Thermodesulfobacteria bacterium]|nr:gamma-glutamyltransferase [Thermodesulfobacteriota bacterium]
MKKGAVACGNRYTAQAACEAFEAGGNAFDAICAAAFAAGVCEAALTSLGGGGFATIFPSQESPLVYDFFVDTPGKGLSKRPRELDFRTVTVEFPGSSQDFHVGLASVAVPGTLKGILLLHQEKGRLPLKEIVSPAIRFAKEGFEVDAFQAYCFKLLFPIFSLRPETAAIFCPKGRPPQEGEILKNPDLASFLEAIPESIEDFYHGELAQRIAEIMASSGGLLTAEDLNSYQVYKREPLHFEFSRGALFTNPPPSFGGPMVCLSLKLFEEHFSGGDFLSREHIMALATTLVEVHDLRERIVREDPFRALELLKVAQKGTTHISTVDAEGNLAALTMTFGEASGFVVPGTGIILNNIMGEDDLHPRGFFADPPGKRISSMMAPSIAQVRDRKIALGSGGSKRIRSAIFEVLVALAHFSLPCEAAVSAPRLHFDGEVLQVEPGIPEETLSDFPYPVNFWPVKDLYFGGVHLVDDHFEGAGDERRAGIFRIV